MAGGASADSGESSLRWTEALLYRSCLLIRIYAHHTKSDRGPQGRRFDNPRQLMAYLGLVPGECSSGQTRRLISITKAGSTLARRLIVEAAWAYRMPAKVGQAMQRRQLALPTSVRDIAWKAQLRLCARYRRMLARRKKAPVVITAIAR